MDTALPPNEEVVSDTTELGKKMTEKIESEVEEAIGDVGRRKEYREALSKAGVSMDFLVEHLKNVALNGEKDSDKIKALQVLLKSLGVDKTSDKEEEGTKTWEDALMNETNNVPAAEVEDYPVNEPVIPESARKQREEDNKATGGIYE